MKTLEHVGNSANLYYYGEPEVARHEGRVWCEVLRSAIDYSGEKPKRKRVPTFHFYVYRQDEGEVANFTYEPKTKPRGALLPDRTVTRLVREHLA